MTVQGCGVDMKYFLIFTFFITFIGCSSQEKKTNLLGALPPKDPSRVEITNKKNEMPKGLETLAGKTTKVLFIYNSPDSFLIKAKNKINPPDAAIQEVESLQSDRNSWLNDILVPACGECPHLKVELPIRQLPESSLLKLMDAASLNREISLKEMADLRSSVASDYVWIILGSEESEQFRGLTRDKEVVAAKSENRVRLRSYIYDFAKNQTLSDVEIRAVDDEVVLYRKSEGAGVAPVLLEKMKANNIDLISDNSLDALMYDEVYPFAPIPESGYIIRQGLAGLIETINP